MVMVLLILAEARELKAIHNKHERNLEWCHVLKGVNSSHSQLPRIDNSMEIELLKRRQYKSCGYCMFY